MNLPVALLLLVSILLPFFPSFHSLSFDIQRFDNTTAGISYMGDARPVQGYVDLVTTDEYFRVGRVVYSEPVYLFDTATGIAADFTTEFNFTIKITDSRGYSDGLAFFIAPVNYPIPPNSAGGFLGLLNLTTGASFRDGIFMVEFDTYPNREYDPLTSHVGINIDSIASAVNTSWDARAESGRMAKCRITYNAASKNVNVTWTYEESVRTAENYSLSHVVDLAKVLPERVTIGFSSATGLFPERHILHSWRFTSNLNRNPTDKPARKPARFGKLFTVTLPLSCLFILSIISAFFFVKVKRGKVREDPEKGLDDSSINRDIERRAFPRKFSYEELVAATDGFSDNRRIGSGRVYRGFLNDLDCMVAVKRVLAEEESYRRFFINEVRIIGRLIHQNIVRFIGWCHENEEYLLVYEYIPNGSLDTYLFGNRRALPWNERYKITLGLATGLHYLHEEAGQCVLHRDVKSANVLLDIDFNAKLGDFGFAKRIDPQSGTKSTVVVGSHEYLALEYIRERRASKESDIFSFGVVVLEIASGRKKYSDGDDTTVPLVKWVRRLYESGRVREAADERLRMGFDEDEMERLLVAGLWCTHPDYKERPMAGDVIKLLKREIPLPELTPFQRSIRLTPRNLSER